ncbi:Uncharacterized protein PECH_000493 [Penicillium ucsense]|uniref:CENP-V/GFA domain-containing protein n=1 Tax=Penicillium ucsense TaxID=2839758 RepID=A0A8J8WK73_9EURO|nr:Uncharacterized protein PECM_004115 [Penicillium ucsense]KAF7733527.1 Uncharacterized protein PECH_000493 [Penicillium ucsense]
MTETYLTGTCLCQDIQYRIALPSSDTLPKVILCHCNNCKRNTGSGFSANIVVLQSQFKYTQGTPKVYTDRSDKGPAVLREFCPSCGTPFSSRTDDGSDDVAVKSGTLSEEDRARCSELGMEIFHHRKDGWIRGMKDVDVPRRNGSMAS